MPVWVDSGIRDGGDVARALALGAEAVLVGRPAARALASGGAAGVAELMSALREELADTMAMLGCADLADVGGHLLVESPRLRHHDADASII